MKIMTGIDLHSNNALCGLMDESGQRLVHKKLPCDLPAILQRLAPYKERISAVAIESTYNWYWLADGLQDHGYRVVLANPARMKPYDGLKHTDDVSDAFFLTELLRLNILPTGHLYDSKTRLYEADTAGMGPFTRADLVARVLAGDTLTIMGVPPASRQRMGRDRNANGVLDGDEATPALTAEQSIEGIVISWPTNTVGVVLEFTDSFSPPNWKTETSVRSVVPDRFLITVPVAGESLFYRLRGL